jgi:hypothetical protein
MARQRRQNPNIKNGTTWTGDYFFLPRTRKFHRNNRNPEGCDHNSGDHANRFPLLGRRLTSRPRLLASIADIRPSVFCPAGATSVAHTGGQIELTISALDRPAVRNIDPMDVALTGTADGRVVAEIGSAAIGSRVDLFMDGKVVGQTSGSPQIEFAATFAQSGIPLKDRGSTGVVQNSPRPIEPMLALQGIRRGAPDGLEGDRHSGKSELQVSHGVGRIQQLRGRGDAGAFRAVQNGVDLVRSQSEIPVWQRVDFRLVAQRTARKLRVDVLPRSHSSLSSICTLTLARSSGHIARVCSASTPGHACMHPIGSYR